MKLLVFFTALLTVLVAKPISHREQSPPSSNGTGISGLALSIRLVDNELANQTGPNAKYISHITPAKVDSQYWATGGDQACADGPVDKSEARKAWEQLRKSCQLMHKNTKIPKKEKRYGKKYETSRKHQELIVEVYGETVVYLCHTGHGKKNKCDPNELLRAEQMMACPGSPRLFDRREVSEPPLLPAPGQDQNASVGAILLPNGETSTNPNDWKFIKEARIDFSKTGRAYGYSRWRDGFYTYCIDREWPVSPLTVG